MQLPALLCGMERDLDRIETAIVRILPVAWLVRLQRLGQEEHGPYPSLVSLGGVAEGHAWRWQSPVAWKRDLGGGVGVDDNVNIRYTYLAVRRYLKATRWRRRGGEEDFGEFSLKGMREQ